MPAARRRHRSAIYAHAAELHAAMSLEYRDALEAHVRSVEELLGPCLVNARGRAAGIRTWDLFTHGPAFANAYATEELRDYWLTHPRPTAHAFERQWLDTHRGGRPA